MHVLISFLGRVPKNETGYRTTRYSFDGVLDEPTAFIGWSLRRRLMPDRLVILGTTGSKRWSRKIGQVAKVDS